MFFPGTDHPLQSCWDLAVAAIQADALACALNSGLFDHLQQAQDATDIADRLYWQPQATSHLLELLWSMRLLERDTLDVMSTPARHYRYRNAAVTRQFFERAAPAWCGDAWLYRLRSLREFGRGLEQQLSGKPNAPATSKEQFHSGRALDWAQAARVQIAQEQRAVTVAAAMDIVNGLPESASLRQVLDLGGGPGWIAIALAGQLAQARFTVFDWPETAAVAQENIEQAGLAARLSTRAGDLASDDIGTGYDLIWCSLLLYFMADQDAALRKMLAALAPGGVLVCVHAALSDDPAACARVAPYYLPMRMLGRHVPQAGELEQRLRQAGFVGIERSQRSDYPMAPVQVLVARRPA